MKKYTVTMHAKERAVERLKIDPKTAEVHLTQLLNNSEEIYSSNSMSRLWEHKKGVQIVTDLNKETIITVYQSGEAPDDIQVVIEDETVIQAVYDAFRKRVAN